MDAGSIGLALGAGMLAAVNPCGFALLPAYLSLFVLDHQELPRPAAVARAARATLALTTGFAAVFLAFGLAVAPVAASVQGYLPAFTVMFGVVLAVVGLWVALGRQLPTIPVRRRRSTRVEPPTASWASMTGFGASYAITSLGCTVAPFLAVVVTSFRSGSTAQGLVLFLVYAGGMGLVVGVAAVATALARGGLITRMRSLGGFLPRIGGLVLVLAGAYVAWYGVWELRVLHAGAGTDPLVNAAESLQRWLAARVQGIGAGGFAIVLGALALIALRRPLRRALVSPESAAVPHAPPTTGAEVMRMQAVFNHTVIADSADTVVVEGNHYFPPDSLRPEYVSLSRTRTLCPWKGLASYYDVEVDGVASGNAAWYYPRPSFLARRIKGRVAFWNGVEVRAVQDDLFRPSPDLRL